MKKYGYIIKSVIAKENRKQLITVATMLANVVLGSAYVIIATVKLSLFIGFSGIYNITLAIAKFTALRKVMKIKGNEAVKNTAENDGIHIINICTLIASLLFFCFGVVITFFYEDPANYGLGMVFFIAGAAFVKIAACIIALIKYRKKRNGVWYYLKLMSAAVALISLALTQRAIFYYVGLSNASLLSGVGGIIFNFFAVGVAVFMILKEEEENGIYEKR